MTTTPGTLLTPISDDHPTLRVVAVDGGRLIVEETDEFSTPHVLTDEEAIHYGSPDAPQPVSEEAGWKRIAADLTSTRAVRPPRPKSPEELLAAGEATPVSGAGEDNGEPRVWGRITFTDEARFR